MKKLYFLVVVLFSFFSVKGQVIDFPDANFKAILLEADATNTIAKNLQGDYFKIDGNDDGEIENSELLTVISLDISNSEIASLGGIENFLNLQTLDARDNQLISLDISMLTNLITVDLTYNSLTFLNVTGLVNLQTLRFAFNEITSIDLSSLLNLKELTPAINPITELELEGLVNLEHIGCNNMAITSLNLNGLVNLKSISCHQNMLTELDMTGLSNLLHLECYGNNLTNLDFSDNPLLMYLFCQDNSLTTLNINSLNHLKTVWCQFNQLENLDVSNMISLDYLDCRNNNLVDLNTQGAVNLISLLCDSNDFLSLDISGLSKLEWLFCKNGNLSTITLNNLPKLTNFDLGFNNLTTVDFSECPQIKSIKLNDNQLISLFIKNGKVETFLDLSNNPNIEYICADEQQLVQVQNVLNTNGYSNCNINSYCSFTPGGNFYYLNLAQKFDNESDGCDESDSGFTNLKYSISNSNLVGIFSSSFDGTYSIPLQGGGYTVTLAIENPSFFIVDPQIHYVGVPSENSVTNFCITPNGIHSDLEVAILPTTPARPGFDAEYKIIIKNKGNIQQSGSVSFAYDDAVLDYVIASPAFTTQSEGSLSWAFANLQPFETREINLTLNVNSPMETPAVNGDDVLTYTATITSEATDELPLDNTFSLPQIVVNSFDPNDKTCLQGTAITPDMIGQYVHYMIRFENTGTFAAENIVVKDMIDTAKFDVSSLVALNGSHPYVTRITGNKVEFIFEGINLPFEDATNDGYVVFKIKTLPTLVLGDSFSNTASIYFDFNHPIVTEPAVTTFAVLGTEDFVFNNYFTIYPNPTNGILNITSKQAIELQSISIYNVLGQMVVSVPNAKGVNSVDVSSLSTGNYFIKVVSDRGTSNSKFIKQ